MKSKVITIRHIIYQTINTSSEYYFLTYYKFYFLDKVLCDATYAGRGKAIDSKWCQENCKHGRHPACNSIQEQEQLCICDTKGKIQ